ncbi:lasso peptide biosynthesis B2 protein [Paenibacillus sp. SI8]|uniref:lasso peptide biosynthesis B2 protein n=1 Tax=unclassified Paenibacillus TaxID=185978 RepID=UPI0034661414
MIMKFFKIYIMMIIFDFELSRDGFNKVFKKYSKKYTLKAIERNPEAISNTAKEIFELFNLIDIVCAWYPRKADCIQKSFLGFKILRKKYSLPVEIVIGIRKFPFEAHAWLQINEKNVFCDDENTKKYNIILRTSVIREGGYY